jgi:membrane-associated phospholipid phosphatase
MQSNRLLPLVALLCAAGLLVTFVVALHTARGLQDDGELYRHVSGNGVVPVHAVGERALRTIDVASVVLAAVAIAFLALVRGHVRRAFAAVAVIGASVLTAEVLKHGLPHLRHALPPGRPATFPSGHTAVAASVGLALVLAAPPLLRTTAALLGAAYAGAVALSTVVLGWHYPSDAVASFFVCGFWAAAVATVLRGTPRRPSVSPAGFALALVLVAAALVAGAVVAGRHRAAVATVRSSRALVATGAVLGTLSLAVFGAITPLVGERRR